MAEELDMHFSSVSTREDTSLLLVPETKFNGSEGEKLGQLVVTPEVVATKIKNMKENKSPGVDGVSSKILKETVEQISTPLAHVFNMSLQEGIVPLEWKEANIIPLLKKRFNQVRKLSTSQFNISKLQSIRKYNYRSYGGLTQQI